MNNTSETKKEIAPGMIFGKGNFEGIVYVLNEEKTKTNIMFGLNNYVYDVINISETDQD